MKHEEFLQKGGIVCALSLFCCFLWGSAFPCIKNGYALFQIQSTDTASQILFAGARFALAGVMVIAIFCLSQKKFLLPKRSSWGMVLKISLCQTIIQYFFFYAGLAHTSGVRGSIIEGSNVFIAILIASLLFHQEKMTLIKGIGCIIGFAGVVLVNLSGAESLGGQVSFNGEGFLLISCVSYAFSSVLIKVYSTRENPVILSGYQFLLGGMVMIVAGLLAGGHMNPTSWKSFAILFYMAFISAAAYSLWSVLLKYNPVSRITVYGFSTPIFGVALSALFLSESSGLPWLQSIAALIMVSAGIYIVNRKEN